MSTFSKLEYAFMFTNKGGTVNANTTLDELRSQNYSKNDEASLKEWKELIHCIDDENIYENYSEAKLAKFLEARTGHACQITPISLYFKRKNGKKYLLAYYKYKGYDIYFSEPQFTIEQRELIEFKSGLRVVNAGPGTGKTTTAVERAFRWKEDKVIIISYSNEAINEVYKRCCFYPGRAKICKKDYSNKKEIIITTVDSLAVYILNGLRNTYDECIAEATLLIKRGGRKNFPFKHIIVDEAQDIDEIRADLIKELYASGNFESMIIFGDPRQRIDKTAGDWYSEMWKNGFYNHPGGKIYSDRIGLTITHRFKNKELLDLQNIISSRRPSLHVELISEVSAAKSPTAIECYYVGKCEIKLLTFIKKFKKDYIDSEKYRLSDICVIIPSISAENVTSKYGQKLCAIFKEAGIDCYIRREGGYHPNGILITTIHSVKGKQFKITILYRMDGYPDGFPIEYELAEGLIYVANTRAEEKIIYLSSKERFEAPRGVPYNLITYHNISPDLEKEFNQSPKIQYFKINEMAVSRDWSKLVETNCYRISNAETFSCPKIPPFNVGDMRLRGVLAGLVVETLVTKKHLQVLQSLAEDNKMLVKTNKYKKYVYEGKIYRGIWTEGSDRGKVVIKSEAINTIRDEEMKAAKEILKKPIDVLQWKEWCLLAQIYDFICGEHMNARYDIKIPDGPFPYEDFYQCAKYLVDKFGEEAKAEFVVRHAWSIGACDLLFKDAIIELKASNDIEKEHRYQVMIYNACLDEPRIMYVYNLNTGTLALIKSSEHVLLWKYLIGAYGTLKNHVNIMIAKKNIMCDEENKQLPEIKLGQYTVDTEFTMGREAEIFDFALINMYDPFASIIQPLKVSEHLNENAAQWLLKNLNGWNLNELRNLLKVARSNLDECFKRINPNEDRDEVFYYFSKKDTEIPRKHNMKPKDIRDIILRKAKIRGTFLTSSTGVKLGEIYDFLVKPIKYQVHLNEHTALSDALVIFELYALGYLI